MPGLGADARMFREQLKAIPNLKIIEWSRPKRADSISIYAHRIAREIPEGPFIIGGVSFGGVIAQEIAAVRRPEGLVLITTLTSSRDIIAPLRLGAKLPAWCFDIITWCSKKFAPLASPIHGSKGGSAKLITRMLATADPIFLSWARRCVLSWETPRLEGIPTIRIHGTHDRMIRPKSTRGIVWVKGAGHVANMTHAGAVNRAVVGFLGVLESR